MTKLCIISDTHTRHNYLEIPESDVLIHCGDYTNVGGIDDVEDFLDWFSIQKATHKILISGNHDLHADPKYNWRTGADTWWNDWMKGYKDIIFLENSGCIINDLKFWGSPVTPWFHGDRWAFNRYRGEDISKVWEEIPLDTDVLITHGPPIGILDAVQDRASIKLLDLGCDDLRDRVDNYIRPKIHCFGHLHLMGGQIYEENGITFINAAMCDESYNVTREPIIINI